MNVEKYLSSTAPIDGAGAAQLMTYAAQIDGRVQVTDANADVWFEGLKGGPFGLALAVIIDYYRKYDPKQPDQKPITPGYIRHTGKDQLAYEKRIAAHQLPPPKIDKGLMPRRVLLKFQANGKLLDRDPLTYPDK